MAAASRHSARVEPDDAVREAEGGSGAAMPAPDLILFALRRANAAVLSDFEAKVGTDDIRPAAYATLVLLKQMPGLRQSQLSPLLGMRRTNLVPLLAELERRGLSERRPVPGDRRAAALFLTPLGREVLARCEAGCAAHEALLSARLGASGRTQLLSLLHRLSDSAFDPPA